MLKKIPQCDSRELAEAIRNEIQRRGLTPGDRLPVHPELAKSLKVGIRRLREALSILRQQGFVETHGKGGTRVAKPSIQSFADSMDWHLEDMGCSFEDLVKGRALIESTIAAEAARNPSAKNLLMILQTIEQEEQDETADNKKRELLDEAFHQAVLQAVENPALVIVGKLIAQQFQRKCESLAPTPKRYREIITSEHREIFEAIREGNSPLAQQLMRTHVEQQLKRDKLLSKKNTRRTARG